MKTEDKVVFAHIPVLIISFIITLFCIFTGNYEKEGYNIAVDRVSPAKITAPFQAEDKLSTEKRRQEAAASVAPLYKLDHEITEKVAGNITGFFEELEKKKQEYDLAQMPEGETPDSPLPLTQEVVQTPIIVTEEQLRNYMALTRAGRIDLRDSIIEITRAIMSKGIQSEGDTKSLLYARDELNKKPWPDNIRNFGYEVISAVLEPNLIIDEQATSASREAKAQEVRPVIIQKDQKIIDEGEIVTEEIYALLESYDLIADKSNRITYERIGISTIVFLIYVVVVSYLKVAEKRYLATRKQVMLLGLLYSSTIIIVRLMCGLPYFIIPMTIFGMLVALLMDQRFAIFINFFMVIVSAMIYKGGIEFGIFFLLSGTVAILMTRYSFERSKMLIEGLVLCIFNGVLVVGVNLFYYKTVPPDLAQNTAIAVSNAFLSLIIAGGSLPLWEALFDITTPTKLMDLTRPNNEVLRQLTIEAPGTYHHSLIVANLAEQAAADINANAVLARVGGYYHDIGKLKYPYYYSENQAGENPHNTLDPYDSKELICKHVPNGMELAELHKLPKSVRDIIYEHHGTTVVKYFCHKAEKLYGEVEEQDFRYKNRIPSSKESAIVMLADTCEAAIRSMINSSKTMDEVEGMIGSLIKDKLDDHQLDDCELTFGQLKIIQKSFMKVFRGMYHERVKYPSALEMSKKPEMEKKELEGDAKSSVSKEDGPPVLIEKADKNMKTG